VHHAVERIGFRGWLRIARRERVLAPLFRRHVGLREEVVRLAVFKSEEHAAFALAVLGVALGVRMRPALALAGPYAARLALRCRSARAHPGWAAWFVLYDALAMTCSARGAIAHRVTLV
jgi:hypothetical protein